MVVLNNRTETQGLGMKTRFEFLYGNLSRNNHIRVFWCAVYAHIRKESRKSKFEDKATLEMYVGLKNGLHDVYISGRIPLGTTKQASFDGTLWPLGSE